MRKLLLLLLALTILPVVAAASYTDNNYSLFNLGTFSTAIVRADQLQLSSNIVNINGLVSYWPFEEDYYSIQSPPENPTGAGDIKDVMALNNATAFDGGASVNAAGRSGHALQTDGVTNIVRSTTKAMQNFNSWFAVSLWVNASNNSNPGGRVILSKNLAGTNIYNFLISTQPGQNLEYSSVNESGTTAFLTGTHNVTDGQWHNVIYQYNGSELDAYVDGALDASANITFTPHSNISDVIDFGYQNFGWHFNGSVDEVAMWNRTLTNGEISSLAAINYLSAGTFTSRVFDLGSNPVNVSIKWNFNTPIGSSLLVSTRSGPNATDFSGWSGWSSSYATSTGSAIVSPMNRYYQYQAQLVSTFSTITPTLYNVTLSYNDTGINVTPSNVYNYNLSTSTGAPYQYYIFVNDTVQIDNITASYSLGNSAQTPIGISLFAPAVYNVNIPGGWSQYLGKNLTVQLNITEFNGTINTLYRNVTELIDDTPPVIDPISNFTILQGNNINITVTGTDFDNQTIVYNTSQANMTVIVLTNTSSLLSWTPNLLDPGLHLITVTANDSVYTSARVFWINVTDINDPPTISAVSAITGYHGVPQTLMLTAYDPDLGENISFSVSPDFFNIYTNNYTSVGNSSFGTYYGVANFTPADPEDGVNNVTFYVTDGTYTANTSATMTINYCGDNVCQTSYENTSSCPSDCNPQKQLDQIALVIPGRNCVNQTSTVYAFNATNRYSCYYEGLVEQGLALCTGIDGVSIDVYYKDGYQLTLMTTLNSGQNGSAGFIPDQVGEYKLVATKEEYANTSAVVTVRGCSENIVVQQDNTTVYQPAVPDNNKPQTPPQKQLPELTSQQTNWLSVFIFYFVVPLLLAALVYTSSVFYTVNKDTLPWLLELRITMYQQRVKYKPQIESVQDKVRPVVEPVVESIVALYSATLKPLIDRIRRSK